MPSVHTSKASLRIFGNAVVPEQITALLGATPDSSHRKGEARPSGHGTWPSGSWHLRAEPQTPEKLDGQIVELFGRLTDDLNVCRALAAKHKVDLFCGLFMVQMNEGLSLSAATVAAIADRRIVLHLDIYGNEPPQRDSLDQEGTA